MRARTRPRSSKFLLLGGLFSVRIRIMLPSDERPDRNDASDEPLENQPLEWAEEDREIEDRKPDLGETEADTSELE